MFAELKKLFKHSFVYGISNILQKGIGFFMIPVYTHFLTPADYGILELMDLTINVISMIAGMGMGAALIRFYHRYATDQERQEVFSTALFFVLVFTIAMVLFLEFFTRPIAGLVLGTPDYYRYFQIMFVSLGLQTIAAIPENQLMAQAKSALYSIISLITLISYLSLNVLFLVSFRWGLLGLLLSTLCTKILNNALLFASVRGNIKISFSKEKLNAMIRFSLPLIPASLSMFVIHFSDRFFVQRYCNLNDLGIYSLGYKFGMIIAVIISQPFFQIWNTQRFEILTNENPTHVFSRVFTYFVAILLFVGLGICTFIDEAIQLMTPEGYNGATHFVALIVLSYVFYGMALFFSLGNMVRYKTKYEAYIQMFSAGVNVILNIVLIKRFGVMGAAYSTMLTFFILWVVSMINSQRLYPIPVEIARISLLFIVGVGLYAVSRLVDASLMGALAIKSLLMFLFPLILLMVGFFKTNELSKFKELVTGTFARIRGTV